MRHTYPCTFVHQKKQANFASYVPNEKYYFQLKTTFLFRFRWSCGVCPYKAYHLNGLNEHMVQEHSRQKVEPTQLPIDHSIEKWVSAFLDHQTAIIEKNKAEFAKQKIVTEKPVPVVAKVVESPKPSNVNSNLNLEQAFGDFGAPINDLYSCPKCKHKAKEETDIRNHLESELTKIR